MIILKILAWTFRGLVALIIFIILLIGFNCILPIGFGLFIVCFGEVLAYPINKLLSEDAEWDTDTWVMMFAFIILPFMTARHYFLTGKLEDV